MASDGWTLGFDTSAAHCAAALLHGRQVVAERVEDMAKGQAERLMPFLQEILTGAGIGWRDLSALGVGIGPGNFTGVRISVAAARGLALSLGIPAVGVSTFDALAEGGPRPLLVVEDARRGEVYAQRFDTAPFPPELTVAEAVHVGDTALTGSAAAAVQALAGCGTIVAPALPLAVAIARITAARVASGLSLPRPAPLYLRGADAAPPSDPPPVLIDG